MRTTPVHNTSCSADSITPDLLGRAVGEPLGCESSRSPTTLTHASAVPFEGGASGIATVEILRSTSLMDEAGYVIRCTVKDEGSAFIPHAVLIPNGIELHIAGDIESEALLLALSQAVSMALMKRSARAILGSLQA